VPTPHVTYHTPHFSYTNIAIYVATYILIFVYHTFKVTVTHCAVTNVLIIMVIRGYQACVLRASLPTMRVVFFPGRYVNRVFFYHVNREEMYIFCI